jgi:hypothetical protein
VVLVCAVENRNVTLKSNEGAGSQTKLILSLSLVGCM